MSKRYTYSRAVMFDGKQLETFTADQFDSFDEAITAVNKGIYERELFYKEKEEKAKRAHTETLPGVSTPTEKDLSEDAGKVKSADPVSDAHNA